MDKLEKIYNLNKAKIKRLNNKISRLAFLKRKYLDQNVQIKIVMENLSKWEN